MNFCVPNVTCSLSTNCAASTHTEILILDDIGYVQQSGDEMEILFTLLSERYECRRVIITLNLYFSQWDQILKDPMTNTAAIDCVVTTASTWNLERSPWPPSTTSRPTHPIRNPN